MTNILSGSTPLRRLPRSAASLGVIIHIGSSCSRSFSVTSGHRRPSTSCNSGRATPWCEISTRARWSPPIMPAMLTARHRLKCRAARSRTSLIPRRSHLAASDKPAGDRSEMIARLDVVAAWDQWQMPVHQPRTIARRHQMHAADRQLYGQPSPQWRCWRADSVGDGQPERYHRVRREW